jgi:hypothetical protein
MELMRVGMCQIGDVGGGLLEVLIDFETCEE